MPCAKPQLTWFGSYESMYAMKDRTAAIYVFQINPEQTVVRIKMDKCWPLNEVVPMPDNLEARMIKAEHLLAIALGQ